MNKKLLSLILVFSMVLQIFPYNLSFSEGDPLPSPEIEFYGDSHWRGYGSEVGDSVLYIELRGKLINTSAGDIKSYLYEDEAGTSQVGETSEAVYIGKNSILQDVVIQKITLDAGKLLESKSYFVEFTDESGNTIIPVTSVKEINNLVYPNPMDSGYVSSPWNTYVNADLQVMNFNITLDRYKPGLTKTDFILGLIQTEDISDLEKVRIPVGVVDPDSIVVNYLEGGTYSIDASFTVGSNLDKTLPIYISISAPDKMNQLDEKYSGEVILLDSSTPIVKKFSILEAIPGFGGGHEGMSGSMIPSQYMPLTSTSLNLSFESLGMDDLSKLDFILKNSQGVEIQTTSMNSTSPLSNGLNLINTTLSINSSLDATNTLDIRYNDVLITSAPLVTTSLVGTQYFLIDGEYISGYVYNYKVSPYDRFNITLLESMNMDPTKFTINFYQNSTLISSLPLSGEKYGTTLELTTPAFNLALGDYDFKVLYNGEEINQVYEADGDFVDTGDFFMSKDMNLEVLSTFGAGLKTISNINNNIEFNGFNFSTDRSYTAYFILHGTNPLTASPFSIPTSFVSSNKLQILESQQSALPRGWYNVYLKDDLGQLVNGFDEVSLITTSGSSQIILPTAVINNDDEYTMDKNVVLNINAGTFIQMKVANTQEELSALPWTSISTSLPHILSDGFGTKNVYMIFRDSSGFEYSLTDSILLRGDTLDDMISFGILDQEQVDGQYRLFVGGDYRFSILSSSRDLKAYVEFYDGELLLGSPMEMNRTLSQNNVHTYSKLIAITDLYLTADSIGFYLKDDLGFTSKMESLDVAISSEAFISSTDFIFEKLYQSFYQKEYILDNSQLVLRLVGNDGFNAKAVLNYQVGEDSKTFETTLGETSKAGSYQGILNIPSDATYIENVTYYLTDPINAENIKSIIKPVNQEVSATLKFVAIKNSNGDFNNKVISINSIIDGASQEYLIKNNETEVIFNGLIPSSNYAYTISDEYINYLGDVVHLTSSGINEKSLADVPEPAKVKVDIPGLSENDLGSVRMAYYLPDSSMTVYLNQDSIMREFKVGDKIRYFLEYDDISSKKYKDMGEYEYTVASTDDNLTVSLTPYELITVTGNVKDNRKSTINLQDVNVNITQTIQNGFYEFDYITTSNSDENGNFTAKLYPGVKANFTFNKQNYLNKAQDITESNDFNLQVGLDYSTNKIVYIKPFSKELVRSDNINGEVELVSYDPINIKSLALYDMNGNRLYASTYQRNSYTDLRYNDGVLPNSQIKAKVEFYDKRTSQAEYIIDLDEYTNGVLSPIALQPGELFVDVVNTNGENSLTYYGLIYNSDGRLEGLIDGKTSLSSSGIPLNPGNYRLVVLKGLELEKLSNYLLDESFELLGLVANRDYVDRFFSIENGVISVLEEVDVPNSINKDLLGTDENFITSKFVPSSSGGRLRVLAQLSHLSDNPDRELNYVVVKTNGTLINNTAFMDGIPFESMYLRPEDRKTPSSTIYFDITPNPTEKTYVGLSIYYEIDDVWITEYLSLDNLELPKVTLYAPDQTMMGERSKEVYLRGVAEEESKVEIYEGDVKLGEVLVPKYRTSYALTVALPNPDLPGAHVLRAQMTNKDDEVFESYPGIVEVIDPDVMAYTSDFEFLNGYGRPITFDGPGDSSELVIFSYNPSYTNTIKFKIVNLLEDELDYVAFVNTYNGIKDYFEATHVSDYQDDTTKYSEWTASARIRNPGDLSVYYAPKKTTRLGYISGTPEIDFEEATGNVNLDTSFVPTSILNSTERTVDSTYNNLDIAIPVGTDGYLRLTGSFEEDVAETPIELLNSGYRQVDTKQGPYWYKETLIDNNGVWTYNRKVFYSPQLTAILKSGSSPIGIKSLSGPMFVSIDELKPMGFFDDALSYSDYTGYLYNLGDFVAETGGNSSGFGIGGKMQVLGGVTFAAQALSGPTSKDTSTLSQLVMKINDPNTYARIQRDIREYDKQRRSTHTVNTILSGASFGAGFGGPLGKGLSYLISTGGMVFGKKSGVELDIWYDAILRDIQNELELQEYRKNKKPAKEDDIKKPKWKMDPSGYVFDAIDSQRIPNITAVALTGTTEPFNVWTEAEEWGEINPDITDIDGRYGWDVPEGNWQVKFIGNDKYMTSLTNTMQVPPVHDQVNIGLISKEIPSVSSAVLTEKGFEVEFKNFVDLNSIFNSENSINNIRIFDGDNNPISIISVLNIIGVDDTVYKSTNTPYQRDTLLSTELTRRIRIIPSDGQLREFKDDGVTKEDYTLTLLGNIQSYSGVRMDTDYVSSTINLISEEVLAKPTGIKPSGTYLEPIEVNFVGETGTTIYYTTDGTDPTTLSRNWTIESTAYGDKSDELRKVNKSTLFKVIAAKNGALTSEVETFRYIIATADTPVASAPTASIPSGTYNGSVTVSLSASAGEIRYTLDGTMPNSSSTLYSGPITISEDTVIRAVTILSGYVDSSVVTFTYTLSGATSQAEVLPILNSNSDERTTTAEVRGLLFSGTKYYTLGLNSVIGIIKEVDDNSSNKLIIDLGSININSLNKLSMPVKLIKDLYDQTDSTISIKSDYLLININREQMKSLLDKNQDINILIEFLDNGMISLRLVDNNNSNIHINSKFLIGVRRLASKENNLLYDEDNNLISFSIINGDYLIGLVTLPIILGQIDNSKIFDDVKDIWYKEYVDFVTSRELFNGTGNGTFSPTMQMTRGMLATVLYRLSLSDNNIEIVNEYPGFEDVSDDKYYSDPIKWAYQRNIISGFGDGRFLPDNNITREQLAQMIFNYYKSNNEYNMVDTNLRMFNDSDQISLWAEEAITFAVDNKLITGKGNGLLDPKGFATRAEVAAILTRYIKLILN